MKLTKEVIGIQHTEALNTISMLAFITDACNYDCYYCYNHKPRTNQFLDLKCLKDFIINLYELRKQNMYIELIGGETLLHKDLLNFIHDMYKFYPNIKFGIYSNLSFPIDTYLDYLKHGVYMTFTWHSLPNDRQNKKFIEKLKQIPKEYFETIAEVHVMYENLYLKESIDAYNEIYSLYPVSTELCLLDHNYENNQIYFCKNCYYSKDELNAYDKTQSKVAEQRKFFTVFYKDGTKENISITTANDTPELCRYKFWQCDAGLNNFYIGLNGYIFPCQSYGQEKDGNALNLSIGHIKTNVDAKSLVFKKHICKLDRCACSWEVNKKKIFK